jgi:hypothetical protein
MLCGWQAKKNKKSRAQNLKETQPSGMRNMSRRADMESGIESEKMKT